MRGLVSGDQLIVNLGCANCHAHRHVPAEFDPGDEDFGLHPFEEYLLTLWSRSHVGPVFIVSYTQVIVP